MAFFDKIKQGLTKTRQSIGEGFNSLFSVFRKVDEDLLDELEELLICADVGTAATEEIITELRERAKKNKIEDETTFRAELQDIISDVMDGDQVLHTEKKLSVILVVGINGVGKTTTIGKLAALLKKQGKHVLLAAGDTFRAAAAEQLTIWANRAEVEIVQHQAGSDPAAVVYDAIHAAQARGLDTVICDTAGRLHNKKGLMDELNKIMRVIDSQAPEASKEILLVLDATTGSNGVEQARQFAATVPLTGIVLTKLDGTAKGGVTLSVKKETGIPVKFIGVGEQMDDLQPFVPQEFAKALLEL